MKHKVDDDEHGILRDADGEPMTFKTLDEALAVTRVLHEAWKKQQRAMGLSDQWPPPETVN